MPEQFVGKRSEFNEGDRRIVFMGEVEIGVFRQDGRFYAYSNNCLHQGGPACEGLIIAKVEEKLLADQTSRGLYFSEKYMPREVASAWMRSSTLAMIRPSQAGPP